MIEQAPGRADGNVPAATESLSLQFGGLAADELQDDEPGVPATEGAKLAYDLRGQLDLLLA